jgi:hypothetical protein
MGCNKKLKAKIMGKVRREYPSYSLTRRKKIVSVILYRHKKKH